MNKETEQMLAELERIVVERQDWLFRFAYMRIGIREDAEDVVQEVLRRSRGQVIDLFTKKSKTCPSDLIVTVTKYPVLVLTWLSFCGRQQNDRKCVSQHLFKKQGKNKKVMK